MMSFQRNHKSHKATKMAHTFNYYRKAGYIPKVTIYKLHNATTVTVDSLMGTLKTRTPDHYT